MWRKLHLFLPLGVVYSCVAADKGLDSVGQGGSIMALNYLGAWEGRRYYRAEDTYATWSESMARCSSQGMVLADLRSIQEITAVSKMLNENHWTAGQQIPSFKWATTTSTIVFPVVMDDWTCVLLSQNGFLYDAPCSGLACDTTTSPTKHDIPYSSTSLINQSQELKAIQILRCVTRD
ncbi:uncharacterized protein LOC110861004 [Folsomia candida]|uniref:uncharacterized protein LOC110861004 n=1 Tax=Folsomia candida TaxID=158441 RepID=UPI000B8F6369|nr:uncharacterized protein LOC110861004 [Folsomia candida]XP_035716769.1 uncharacterized protein LOC110861004 [Folsomia candida]